MTNTLFVFTKPNRMGVSKTRLAKELGYSEARRINAMATSRVVRNITSNRWQAALMVAPDKAVNANEPLWPNALIRLPQGDGDLGDRMTRAFESAPLGKVLFIGTDMPDLSRAHICRALYALQTNHAVFGPADDGGFWLFGMRKQIGSEAPFFDVRWSTEHALADVERNLGIAPIAFLDTKIDLDDAAAWHAWNRI